MRIALAIQSLNLARGGAERFTRNLIRGLTVRSHDIVVFCHDWDAGATMLDIDFVRIPPRRPWHHPWYEFSRNVWQNIRSSRTPFDIVFGLTQLYPQDVHRFGGGVYRYWYEKKYDKLLPLHRLRPRIHKALAFERAMYTAGNYRQVIAISDMDRKLLMQYYHVPPDRVHTVYNGFDFDEFHGEGRPAARARLCSAHGIPPSTCIVLFAANNYVRKGLPQAVEALCRLPQPSKATLVVIGKPDATLRARLEKRSSFAFTTIWLDRVSNPADYYRGADVMLFPTQYDSFANVIGEAMLCGLPVITTEQAGGAEMIVHTINGFIATNADAIDELTSYVEQMTDRACQEAFSARAAEKVRTLSIARCSEETERILMAAAEEKKKGR